MDCTSVRRSQPIPSLKRVLFSYVYLLKEHVANFPRWGPVRSKSENSVSKSTSSSLPLFKSAGARGQGDAVSVHRRYITCHVLLRGAPMHVIFIVWGAVQTPIRKHEFDSRTLNCLYACSADCGLPLLQATCFARQKPQMVASSAEQVSAHHRTQNIPYVRQ